MSMSAVSGAAALISGLVCCAVAGACAAKPDERRLLAENAQWRVWASGEFSRPGSFPGGDAVVLFSVEHRGQEFAAGELYRAGGNDRPFDRLFSKYDWVSPNALRLFIPTRKERRFTTVRIQNSAQLSVKWLLLQAAENILTLDIHPGASIEVPLAQLSERHLFNVTGEFADGTTFEGSHSPSVPSDATLTLRVASAGTTVDDR